MAGHIGQLFYITIRALQWSRNKTAGLLVRIDCVCYEEKIILGPP